ncbi:MAG: hypothetical protein IJZ39_12980 [Oscillospiraceae bacterium]|nr:hypothetical protein [Oscillospiraceae bacterium]
MKKIRIIGAAAVAALWMCLTLWAWFKPADAVSSAERRPLEQFPEISVENILDAGFMGNFEDYTLDQFPLRDGFRSVKALFQKYVMGQKDNNGIYVTDGHAAKLEYPYDEASIAHAAKRFQYVYDTYLTGCDVYMTIVPDKGYYLAEENGYPAMDYDALFADLQAGMPYAKFIDLRDTLTLEDYYRTDTHWRQENLLPAAEIIADAMGITVGGFTPVTREEPFYGVYHGQAALPMEPDELVLMESDWLSDCRVYDHESGTWGSVYDLSKLNGDDLYEVFLSGPRSLLTIENPNAKTDKELIVFRDSFGSAMVPLLLQDYARVDVVDIRYLNAALVGNFLDFHGQDVLYLYSTLVLNNAETIK